MTGDLTGELRRRGWPDVQARALAQLVGAAPGGRPWGNDGKASSWRADRLRLWANNRDIGAAEVQLDFLTYELKTVFSKLVQAANKETTAEGARQALAPYFTALKEGKPH